MVTGIKSKESGILTCKTQIDITKKVIYKQIVNMQNLGKKPFVINEKLHDSTSFSYAGLMSSRNRCICSYLLNSSLYSRDISKSKRHMTINSCSHVT